MKRMSDAVVSRSSRALVAGLSALPVLLLAGCGGFTAANLSSPAPVTMEQGAQGRFMGGQQPVAGVTLQMYEAGISGYGSAATALFPAGSVKTVASGNFTLPSFSCTTGRSLYLVGIGGTPIGGSANANLALMVGLGPCESFSTSNFIAVNEVTTVATVWAMGHFMTGVANIGAPAGSPGLIAAFAAINKLVNTQTGAASGPALPSNATIPMTEINALGNILQNCVNSAGGSASDSTDGYTNGTPCGKLFFLATPGGGTAPTDTITAAMNIAQNPALPAGAASVPSYVAKLDALQASSPAFSPAYSVNAPPTDWTIAINYTGGGLSTPQTVATDASGNVWVANRGSNSVSEFSNVGAALSGTTGYTVGSLNVPWGLAIDQSGSVWVTNSGNNTLSKLNSTGTSGTVFSGNQLSTPKGVAIDGSGNVWVANSGSNYVSEFNNSGAVVSAFTGGGITTPTSIAINPK